MSIIDFRVRPPYGAYQKFVNVISAAGIGRYDFEYKGSLKSKSLDDFIKELDDSGIEKAVIPGRRGDGIVVENEELFEFSNKYPDRFIIFPFLDPIDGQKALDDIDKYIINGRGVGASLEPGLPGPGSSAYALDDARAYPMYRKLEENNIPVLITFSSLALEEINSDSVRQLDKVARDFPNLVIVVAHGGWPWTREMIAIAFSRKNVYLAPDVYATIGAGADDYIRAAKTILRDKIIFESSYPIAPVDQSVDFVKNNWGLNDEVLEKVLHGNAAKILENAIKNKEKGNNI